MEERTPTRAALSEARETGCDGLLTGIASNLYTHKRFYAESSQKSDGPFYCEECNTDVVLRKCTEKIDHFAHIARLSPDAGSVESDLHRQCKEEICKTLQKRFPEGRWAMERPLKHCYDMEKNPKRPDVSGFIGQQALVIEVQASCLSLTEILSRIKIYNLAKCAILWVVPLKSDLGTERFRPRLYERYLHSIYFGRIYYWQSGNGLTVLPVHYGKAYKHVESRSWYENGKEQSTEAYDKPLKIIKTPIPGSRINIANNFKSKFRDNFKPHNERKEVPLCKTWQDELFHWWDTNDEKKFRDNFKDDFSD